MAVTELLCAEFYLLLKECFPTIAERIWLEALTSAEAGQGTEGQVKVAMASLPARTQMQADKKQAGVES